MEGERQSLVFESDSTMSRDGGGKALAGVEELFRSFIVPADMTGGIAALEAMESGNRQAGCSEDGVHTLDRSAAYQSERSSGSMVQVANERVQIVLEPHLRWRRRQIRERAIDVEEERPPRVRRRNASRSRGTRSGAAGTKWSVSVAAPPNGRFHSVRRGCRLALKEMRPRRAAGSIGAAASGAGVRDDAWSPRRAASDPPTCRR